MKTKQTNKKKRKKINTIDAKTHFFFFLIDYSLFFGQTFHFGNIFAFFQN